MVTKEKAALALRAFADKLDAGEWADTDQIEMAAIAKAANAYQFDQAGRNQMANSMTRESFDLLGAQARMDFVKNGGKVVNV